MFVWRVQNEKGIGPYMGGAWDWMDDEIKHIKSDHPPVFVDSPLIKFWMSMQSSERNLWKCGFKSREQLLTWFSIDELAKLNLQGFKVVAFEADEVKEGEYQVIFKERSNPYEKHGQSTTPNMQFANSG